MLNQPLRKTLTNLKKKDKLTLSKAPLKYNLKPPSNKLSLNLEPILKKPQINPK